jgi:hypothetical protein
LPFSTGIFSLADEATLKVGKLLGNYTFLSAGWGDILKFFIEKLIHTGT